MNTFGYQPSTSKQNPGNKGRADLMPVLRAVLRDPLFPVASDPDLRRAAENGLVHHQDGSNCIKVPNPP